MDSSRSAGLNRTRHPTVTNLKFSATHFRGRLRSTFRLADRFGALRRRLARCRWSDTAPLVRHRLKTRTPSRAGAKQGACAFSADVTRPESLRPSDSAVGDIVSRFTTCQDFWRTNFGHRTENVADTLSASCRSSLAVDERAYVAFPKSDLAPNSHEPQLFPGSQPVNRPDRHPQPLSRLPLFQKRLCHFRSSLIRRHHPGDQGRNGIDQDSTPRQATAGHGRETCKTRWALISK